MDFQSAKFMLLEAVARLELAARPRTPPPPPPQPWNADDGSPPFEVEYRSCARSRSPSPFVTRASVRGSPEGDALAVIASPKATTPPMQIVRRRRGFREAYVSPLARLPPIVNHCIVRSGEPNPKYERVGPFLVLRH